MRVLYLTMNPNRESTTVPTEGWFRLLGPQGLEPVLVSRETGAFQGWAKARGVPCYQVPLPFPDRRRPLPFLSALARIVWIAKRHRVELLHCNEQEIYPIGQYAARLLRIPVAVSVHFTMRDTFSKWAFRGRRCPDRIFFVSGSNLEACRPGVQGVVPEDRWRVLYNGLNLQHYRPDPELRMQFRREHGLGDALMVGVACALRPRKQLEHLFQAVSRLTTPSVRLVLAGGPVAGDEDYAATLLQNARRLLGDRFLHVGHLRELRPFYNALDLFINTSQEEACSISVLESMACGCPVVGYPSVSVGELVLPTGGEIIAQDDIDALARAADGWLGAPDRLTRGRRAARERAEHFDIARLAQQLWGEYVAVLRDVTHRPAGKLRSAQIS